MEDDVFEQVKQFVEESRSNEVAELENEIFELESSVEVLESEVESLDFKIENIQEKHEKLQSAVSNLLEVFDESVLDKNQTYYFDKLVEALKEN